MVMEHHGRAVGAFAAVFKPANVKGRRLPGAYLGDFKLERRARGGQVARRVALRALVAAFLEPRFWKWRVGYFAAMRGEKGDVTRSMRGLHLGAINRPLAELNIYFESPDKLATLDCAGCPPSPSQLTGIDLSPDAQTFCNKAGWMSTAGRKDLRLVSAGRPWPLAHIPGGPASWTPTLAHTLKQAGESIQKEAPDHTACFSLDQRLSEHCKWLMAQGIAPGATCGVYGLALLRPGTIRKCGWVHLATSEI